LAGDGEAKVDARTSGDGAAIVSAEWRMLVLEPAKVIAALKTQLICIKSQN
jgi:hypothetical protein